MLEDLEITAGKFIFKVATDRFYTPAGVWALPEGSRIRIGLSDFEQQRSGDVAFVEIKPAGTTLSFDEEVAVVETIKSNLSLGSPVAGRVVEVNPGMAGAPEAINQDPYGAGWMAVIEAVAWEEDRARLLDPRAYFAYIQTQAEDEANQA